MAKIGLRHIVWSPIVTEPAWSRPTYGVGRVIGKAISLNMDAALAEGEQYADDQLSEYASEFVSGNLKSELDDIEIQDKADFFGATYAHGEIVFGSQDSAPFGGLGGVAVRIRNGVKSYVGVVYHKCKGQLPSDAFTTKGNGFTFGNQPLNARVFADNRNNWKTESVPFETESAATAWVDNFLNVGGARHKISVQVQGASAGEGATPAGEIYIAAEGTFEMTVTGTPTALYDNGVESKASISDGKYTLSNLSANHTIAVIF